MSKLVDLVLKAGKNVVTAVAARSVERVLARGAKQLKALARDALRETTPPEAPSSRVSQEPVVTPTPRTP